MNDFLSNLVQKSVPGNEQAPAGMLAPRLPALFETPAADLPTPETEPGMPAAPVPHADVTKRRPDNQRPSPTLVAPYPTTPQPATPARDGLRTIAIPPQPSDKAYSENQARADEPNPASGVQVQVLRNVTTELIRSTIDESPAQSPARLVPLPQASQPVNRQERRAENATIITGKATGTNVRISIGRVEVRAVHPSQPQRIPKKSTVQPRLSLEEYQKHRNEGKR